LAAHPTRYTLTAQVGLQTHGELQGTRAVLRKTEQSSKRPCLCAVVLRKMIILHARECGRKLSRKLISCTARMPCQTDYVVFAESRLLTAGEKDERMDAQGTADL
jgi:hypothetical protein